MRLAFVVVLSLYTSLSFCQSLESLIINYQEEFGQRGNDILALENGEYSLSLKRTCADMSCSSLLKFNSSNQLTWSIDFDSLHTRNSCLSSERDDIFFLNYDKPKYYNQIINTVSTNGEVVNKDSINDNQFEVLSFSSFLSTPSYFMTTGQAFEKTDPLNVQSVLIWYDRLKSKIDTLHIIDISQSDLPTEISLDKDSLIILLVNYSTGGINSRFHRKIIKYNHHKEEVWSWTSEGLDAFQRRTGTAMTILNNNNIALLNQHEETGFTSSSIWCIDENGEKIWQQDMYTSSSTEEVIYDMNTASNGDILASGYTRNVYLGEVNRAGFIIRLSPDGEIRWKHAYADTLTHIDIQNGELLSVEEMTDGSIVATGYALVPYIDANGQMNYDQDLWIIHVDENGCLEDGCGTDIILADYKVIANDDAVSIFPNPASDVLNITSKKLLQGVVELYDLNGHSLYQDQLINGSCLLSTIDLPSGIYLVKIYDSKNANQQYKKVMIR